MLRKKINDFIEAYCDLRKLYQKRYKFCFAIVDGVHCINVLSLGLILCKFKPTTMTAPLQQYQSKLSFTPPNFLDILILCSRINISVNTKLYEKSRTITVIFW